MTTENDVLVPIVLMLLDKNLSSICHALPIVQCTPIHMQ